MTNYMSVKLEVRKTSDTIPFVFTRLNVKTANKRKFFKGMKQLIYHLF